MSIIYFLGMASGLFIGISLTIASSAIGTYIGGGEVGATEVVLTIATLITGLIPAVAKKPIARWLDLNEGWLNLYKG